jgi:hypothetical protein
MVSPSHFAQQGGPTTAFFMLLLLLPSCAHVCLQISPHRLRPQKEMHFWIASFIHVFCTDPLIHTTIFEEKAFQKYWMLVRSCRPVLIWDLKWDFKIWSLAITGCHISFEDFRTFRQEHPKEPSEQVPGLSCCKYWPHSLPTFWYNVGTLTRIHSIYFWQCSSCTNVSSRYWYVGEN